MEIGIIRFTLSPSCEASTHHHRNRTLCPKLQILEKKFILPTRKVLENQFSNLKRKKLYFWQCSCTVVQKAIHFAYGLTLGRTTISPTKKPTVPTTKKPYWKAVCLRPKPYTWQHWAGAKEDSTTFLRQWSSWTGNSDKKLNVNKPYVTSRKTAFRKFCKIFCQFSKCHKFW